MFEEVRVVDRLHFQQSWSARIWSDGGLESLAKESIDPELARGLTPGGETIKATQVRMILVNPTLKTFAI